MLAPRAQAFRRKTWEWGGATVPTESWSALTTALRHTAEPEMGKLNVKAEARFQVRVGALGSVAMLKIREETGKVLVKSEDKAHTDIQSKHKAKKKPSYTLC